MPKILAPLLIFLFFLPGLYAQEMPTEDEPDVSIEEDEENYEEYNPSLYSKWDKTFSINAGAVFPIYFSGGGIKNNDHGIKKAGGTGALAFSIFLTPRIFIGGEINGLFIGTRGGSMLYVIPMGLRVGYQFVIRRFEIPISFMIGGAPQIYLEENLFGLFMKAGAALYWRFNPDWSFGLNTNWWIVPQIPKSGGTVIGNFFELTLSARYHF